MPARPDMPAFRRCRDPYARLRRSLDIDTLMTRSVSIVGGAFGLACDLARCGVGRMVFCDYDRVESTNVSRQDFDHRETDQVKVEAIAARIRAINPECELHTLPCDITRLGPSDMDLFFESSHLNIIATDDFGANAYANTESLRRGVSNLHVSLYAGGGAGEIIYWVPGVTPADYRCIASGRYQHFADGQSTKTPSDGATIFDLRAIDAVAGQIALGILTRGADNRYGALIKALGNRNLIQIRNDPEWLLGGTKDIFKAHLGDSPANFSFTSICLAMEAEPDCPDCALFNGRRA